MTTRTEELIFYGDDVHVGVFPGETRFVYANDALDGLRDFRSAIRAALDNPLGRDPLEVQLGPSSRVTIAFDDPCLPVPLMIHDPRSLVMEELLARLFRMGIPKDRIRIICANGLHRKWTLSELACVLGRKVISTMGPQISCHDATAGPHLVHLGTTREGFDVEINRACVESDMLIYVNLNFTTMNGWPKSVLVGLGLWSSIRHHHGPAQWNTEHSIMDPASCPMHAVLRDMEPLVNSHCNVFQIETVTNNMVWPFPLDRIMGYVRPDRGAQGPGALRRTALAAASLAPDAVKAWVRTNLVRSAYRPVAIHAGDGAAVHAKTLEILFSQQNVPVDGQSDIVIYGVPNLSPYSALSVFNPILLRSLVMGYLVGLFRGMPLVRDGGVIVAYNPGIARFSQRHHPAYIDFWEHHLPEYEDPVRCWEELAGRYADDPRYTRLYRDEFAYHGTHGLINWMWSGMGMRHVRAVILAGAKEPHTARKLGFIPEPDLSRAIDHAREMTCRDARITYQVVPPLFCVDVT